MNTDKRKVRGSESVCICVHLWLILFAPLSNASADELYGVGPAATQATTTTAATQPTTRALRKNLPNVVDILEHIDSADGWSAGTMTNVTVIADEPPRIALGYRERLFPREGVWTGPEVETKFPFTELIASFNPHTPDDTGVTLEIRVKQGDAWSPWLFMQSWGRVIFPPTRTIKFDAGAVDIDTIELTKSAEAYQCRVGLVAFNYDTTIAPSIRRLSVCYSGVVADAKEREKLLLKSASAATTLPSDFARDLAVPFHGQGDRRYPRSLWGLICSPTSTSMVLEFHGATFTALENCDRIYDPQYDLFGNWGRAVARAGEVGFDAWLARFRNWDQVKQQIADGTPVVASIRFSKGQVKGFLYERTFGHLLVVRGFTADGGVIVNDPASREKGAGAVYPAAEFAKAWFDNGGVGYVIKKPPKAVPASLVRSSNRMAASPAATAPTTAPVATSVSR
ncbi:MAG: hypothetical protein QOE14_1127 [Humisphaera sp.]|nr:hypothetical protein [Humisphaera sp.]